MNWNDADDMLGPTVLHPILAALTMLAMLVPWWYGMAHFVAWTLGALPW